MEKYILVYWPYSQEYIEHPRFNERYLLQALEGQEHFDSAYFVPIDLHREVNDIQDKHA
jgi:hypothetical protein